MGRRSREIRERQSRKAAVNFSAVDEAFPRTAMSSTPSAKPKPLTDSDKAWSRSVCDCGALLPAHWHPTRYACRCGDVYYSAFWRTRPSTTQELDKLDRFKAETAETAETAEAAEAREVAELLAASECDTNNSEILYARILTFRCENEDA